MKNGLYIIMAIAVSILFTGIGESHAGLQEREMVAQCALTESSPDYIQEVFDPRFLEEKDSITYLNVAPGCKYTVEIVNTSKQKGHAIYFNVPGVGRGVVRSGGKWERKDLTYQGMVTFSLSKGDVETVRRGSWLCLTCITTGREKVGEGTLTVYKQNERTE